MGTRFELVLHGSDPHHLRAAGEAAVDEIEDSDRRFSLFRRDSLLSHINREAASGWVHVDDEAFELLELCAEVTAASDGAFDPTIAPRMRELGFHAALGASPGTMTDAPTGWQHVALNRERRAVRFDHPGMSLDLGAVAKGFALDRATAILREEGVTCALLHGGTSTVVAVGHPPDSEAWRVAMARTRGAPIACLRDAALSVSAHHGRQIERGNQKLGHVLDPATGRPATGDTRIAVVLDATAGRADAWSTALLVRGPALRQPPTMHFLSGTGEHWHVQRASKPHCAYSEFLNTDSLPREQPA